MEVKLNDNERIDQLYSQDIKIIQSSEVFSFSIDAVLLANFAKVSGKKINNIVDLCAGNGAVGLFLAPRTNGKITSIEIQPKLAEMASRSVLLNDLQEQVTVINDDLKNALQYLKKDSVDVIVCNPPYFLNYDTSLKNPNEHLAIARHEITITLAEILKISSEMLKMNSKIYLVYRPDRLTDLITNLRNNRLEPKRIQFVRSKESDNANMVLVEAIKDGKFNGLKVVPDLVIYDGDSYSKEVSMMLYGKK